MGRGEINYLRGPKNTQRSTLHEGEEPPKAKGKKTLTENRPCSGWPGAGGCMVLQQPSRWYKLQTIGESVKLKRIPPQPRKKKFKPPMKQLKENKEGTEESGESSFKEEAEIETEIAQKEEKNCFDVLMRSKALSCRESSDCLRPL
ncbi:hypothetical protein HHI36_004548 [Cryptolaemus montrouzieri]|uniref:Uncharacterized protein n=1 Tax=Cryptolaemus montrouzieri TaxID=559131 RepID=A0ABD2NRI5_9CUCU